MTFLRVYVNKDTVIIYQILFERIFDLIRERTEREIRWRYLYEEGHAGIVIDMNSKLSTGKTLYYKQINNTLQTLYKRI